MNPRILEGGGLLGGYSFDKIEAEPDTHLTAQIDGDGVAALLRLQCASEEYLRAQNDEARRRWVIEAVHSASSIFACNISGAWAEDLACQLRDLDCGIVGPLLTHTPHENLGAPPRRIQIAVLRIFGAAYLSMLIQAGMSVRDADAKVKQRMKSRFARAGIPLTKRKLTNWRGQIMSKRERRTVDAEIYWDLLRQRPRTIKEIDEWADTWLTAPL